LKISKINIVFSGLEHFVSISILFVTYRIVFAQTGGIQIMGLWAIFQALVSFPIIGTSGYATSAIKFVSKYNGAEETHFVQKTIDTIVIVILLATVLICVSMWLFLYFKFSLLFTVAEFQQLQSYIYIILLSLIFSALGKVYMSALDGLFLIPYRSAIGILSRLAFFISCLLLIKKYGFQGLVLADFFQNGVLFVGGLLVLKIKMKKFNLIAYKFDVTLFKEIFKYGNQFQVAAIFQLFMDPMTKIFLKSFGNISAVAIYDVVYKIFMQSRTVIVVILNTFLPVLGKLSSEMKEGQINDLYKKIFSYSIFCTISIFSVLFLIMPFLLKFVGIANDFTIFNYNIIISLSMLSNMFGVTTYIFNIGTGQMKGNIIYSASMAAFNFLIGLILGYFYGANGVILSAMLAQLFGVIIINMYSIKLYKLHFKSMMQKEEVITCSLFLILVALIGARKLLFSNDIVIDIVLNSIMFIALFYYFLFRNKYGKEMLQKFI
jgi:O-antigen/teichoic acid export membrane protein